ncbi:uncharacterized protein [Mytilus edulis]|uniref:uncharacterized protein n=1 Tax=Mytilus edulis TaxID=6550 RepID=UPI0039EE97CD
MTFDKFGYCVGPLGRLALYKFRSYIRVKWKCKTCNVLMCNNCKSREHSNKGHQTINLRYHERKITDVKKCEYNLKFVRILAVSGEHSLWIGNGCQSKNMYHPTSLQCTKVGDTLTVISSFNMVVKDIAVTTDNYLLLATGKSTLKQIRAGSSKVTDSIYYVESSELCSVHVEENGRVIVGGYELVVTMNTKGVHCKRYDYDEDFKPLVKSYSRALTSTGNGNIFVIDGIDVDRVAILGEKGIIGIYSGPSTVTGEDIIFNPQSVVTTSLDNVIVADYHDKLHILDNRGYLLTKYDTKDIGISYPLSLAITTEGTFSVLYIGCYKKDTVINAPLYKMCITGF